MLNLWLLTCFMIASLGGTVGIGDDYERKGARPRRKTSDDPLMKGLSMEDWHAMARVALVLYVDNAHLAHGTDSEMAEALYHHYQNVIEPENLSTTASGPSHAPTTLEQPPQKKKKKAIPNKKIANTATTTTESVAKDLTVTEPIYVSGENRKNRRPEDAGPVTYRNDGDTADLIERSISKLIPTIADEAVRCLTLHVPTSSATATPPVLHDMDVVDMDITRLRDEALNSHQIGRASERQCLADIISAVQKRLLNQIQNGEFVEFHFLLPSHLLLLH